jgi:hypothetical protein
LNVKHNKDERMWWLYIDQYGDICHSREAFIKNCLVWWTSNIKGWQMMIIIIINIQSRTESEGWHFCILASCSQSYIEGVVEISDRTGLQILMGKTPVPAALLRPLREPLDEEEWKLPLKWPSANPTVCPISKSARLFKQHTQHQKNAKGHLPRSPLLEDSVKDGVPSVQVGVLPSTDAGGVHVTLDLWPEPADSTLNEDDLLVISLTLE